MAIDIKPINNIQENKTSRKHKTTNNVKLETWELNEKPIKIIKFLEFHINIK